MSAAKANAIKNAYIQYSKKIATAIAVFWCAYRILNLFLLYFKPSIGVSLEKMLTGVDDVMMVSIGFYTGNSVIEKGIAGYFGRVSKVADMGKDPEPAAEEVING